MIAAMPVALCCMLRWRPLRRIVVGHDIVATPATLPFHRAMKVHEAGGPALGPGDGIPVEIVQPDDAALARIDFYARVNGYEPCPAYVADGIEVVLYAPVEPVIDRPPWSLEAWRKAHGDLALAAAVEVMDYAGEDPQEVRARMPAIERRAQARLRALPGDGRRGSVEVTDRARPYGGFYSVEEYALRHPLAGGGTSEEIRRAVFHGFDSSIVLPWDPERARVLLVEQFRVAPFARGDADPWSLEAVGGIIDPGETPEDAARREVEEEAGVTPRELIPVGAGYPSPGNSTEFHHHFIAICDLPDPAAGPGGRADEGEDILAHLVPEDRLFEDAHEGRVRVAPLALLSLWLAAAAPGIRRRLAEAGGAS